MPKLIVFLFLLVPLSCLAQFTISGRVLNQVDGKPVANASVFLSNATTGGKTANDGTFTLQNAKPGKYTMVISCIGFDASSQPVMVSNNNVDLADIMIFPKSIGLKGVTIKPRDDASTTSMYRYWFEERFLGNSEQAKQCKILNPEILDFDYDKSTKTLIASTSDFLEIENDALGYKVKYLLTNFTWDNSDTLNQKMKYEGPVLFEPMKGSASQQRRWQRARRDVYEGSEMHFFRSVIASRIDDEGFKLIRLSIYANPERPSDSIINAKIKYFKEKKASPRWKDSVSYWTKMLGEPKIFNQLIDISLNKGDIIRPTDQRGLYALGCEFDGLYVIYNHEHRFPENMKKMFLYNPRHTYNPNDMQASLISFNEPFAFIDRNGMIANPYSITINGRWGFNRVPELLPSDYDPSQNGDIQVDSTVFKNVTARLNSFEDHHKTEKAYLHFDKPYYAAGDTMYFKAYVTSDERHHLSGLSGVLHVDLVNTNNKVDKIINLELVNGLAWGDFALPDSLPKGGYRVRAYTRLMMNDKEPFVFDQVIPVGSILSNKVSESSKSNSLPVTGKPDIQFFPEGGELVTDVRSKVAFKAISNNGSGINAKGIIIDNDNKEVAAINTTHLGMGYFYLTPQEGKTYKAKLAYPDGTQTIMDIPKANSNGIALSVNNDSLMEVSVKVEAGIACFKANRNKDYTLMINSGGIAKSIIFKLDNPVVTLGIVRRQFNSGVVRITLFSPLSEPLCERLFFIKNDDQLGLTVNTDKANYSKKEKVNIKLNASDNGDPATGHFSVSVIDESKVPMNENAENTILTNLLLTSDLKGYIEQPNYYFIDESDKAHADLDLVMLTHGYRKFAWKQVMDSTASKTSYQPETSLELSGTVKTLSGKPIPNAGITLLSVNENIVRDTTADVNGHFKFTDLNLSDTSKLVINAKKTDNSSRVNIELDKPEYPPITNINYEHADTTKLSAWVTESMQKQLEQRRSLKNGIMLNQVNIKSTKDNPFGVHLNHSANLNGPGNADQVILGDKLVGCPTLADCLVSRIHGVRIKYGSDGTPTFFSIHTTIALNGNTKPMAVLVDGIIRDQSALTQVSNTDVASIEVLESASYLTIYGSQATGGLIVINTKRGDEARPSAVVPPGTITYHFNGYYKAREFYSPKYDKPIIGKENPDLRTTIFWAPEVMTDKDGNASLEYYNADGPGTYRVVVEGIDDNGSIGRQVYRYTVK